MSQKPNKSAAKNPFLILLLPMIIVFDFVYYWINRSSCLNCGNLFQFLTTSSLTIFILSRFFNQSKQK